MFLKRDAQLVCFANNTVIDNANTCETRSQKDINNANKHKKDTTNANKHTI